MRILVTGGAGFIASHITDAYITAGHQVAVIDNMHHGFKQNVNKRAKFFRVDIRNVNALHRVCTQFKPQLVNHHAAISEVVTSMREPNLTVDVNVIGTANLLHCATTVGTKKIIFASTGGTIYGNAKRLPTPETAALNPISAYAASKQLGEAWIQYYQRAYGLHYTIFRYGNVFGVRQDPHGEAGVIAIFAGLMTQGMQTYLFGDGQKQRDYVYIDDIVQANKLALTRGNNEIYNLGLGKGITDQAVHEIVASHFQQVAPAKHKAVRPGEVSRTYVTSAKAKRELGWKPHWTLRSGVADYVKRMGYDT